MTRRTGIVRDNRYLRHGAHYMEPETPRRLEAIYAMLDTAAMKEKFIEIAPRHAEVEELKMFHEPAYIERVAGTTGKKRVSLDPDTETTEESYDTARLAAGGVMNAVDSVMSGDCDNAFALIRPPGHHADAGHAAGFCIFNNVVLGALHALAKHHLSRILIGDWDMHHGNGTQDAFYADGRVLYFSTHEFPAYPGTGRVEETGCEAGTGCTINVPLAPGAGNAQYVTVFKRILEPVAMHFRPELILLSAGFDIHEKDPLGGMKVTEKGFAALTRILMNIADACCGGKLVAVLEGGYNLSGLTESVKAVLLEMRDDTRISDEDIGRMEQAAENRQDPVCERVVRQQKPYWPVF
ncbi:MAG: histone deacetylase [Deltaproteobacteria bacterium]|nr:histone deacetylase [Deltaproteobacteria bacterium]